MNRGKWFTAFGGVLAALSIPAIALAYYVTTTSADQARVVLTLHVNRDMGSHPPIEHQVNANQASIQVINARFESLETGQKTIIEILNEKLPADNTPR